MTSISARIKKRAPERAKGFVRALQLRIQLLRNSVLETGHFVRHSHGLSKIETQRKSRYALLKAYHGVEKGLSIGGRRPGFGQPKIVELIKMMRRYQARFGTDAALSAAMASLDAYQIVQDEVGADISKVMTHLGPMRSEADWPSISSQDGGTMRVTKQQIMASVQGCGSDFFHSRHSLRNFSKDEIPIAVIEEAVRRATKTPSVCNRQAPKVYCYADAAQVLKLQPGNAGFGHNASYAVVVTADISAFSGVGERHQAFVDGGMFAMSLLYAFHSLALGACPLAWNATFAREQDVKQKLGIEESEAIIMFMAVGGFPEEFEAATAKRLSLDTWLTVVSDGMPQLAP